MVISSQIKQSFANVELNQVMFPSSVTGQCFASNSVSVIELVYSTLQCSIDYSFNSEKYTPLIEGQSSLSIVGAWMTQN
jgi:hypothetical protein